MGSHKCRVLKIAFLTTQIRSNIKTNVKTRSLPNTCRKHKLIISKLRVILKICEILTDRRSSYLTQLAADITRLLVS